MRPWVSLLVVGCIGQTQMGGGAETDVPSAGSDSEKDDGGDGNPPDPAVEPGDGSIQQICVDEINRYRATLGLYALGRWEEGEACADDQCSQDSVSGLAHGAFGQCDEWAQNECPGWPQPIDGSIQECLAMMWAEGPGEDFSLHGHYINMSSESYTEVACGYFITPAGDYWAIQNFR